MSFIGGTFIGGLGYGVFGPGYGSAEAVPANNRPELGEATTAFQPQVQRVAGPNSLGPMMTAAMAAGGAAGIPLSCGGAQYSWSPGGLSYQPPVWGTYATYRLMSDQPSLKLAWHYFADPIIAAAFTVEGIDKHVQPAWIDLVKDQVLSQLPWVIPNAMESLAFGWQPFEKVWSVSGGKFRCDLRPFYQDFATIYLTQGTGRFAGVSLLGPNDVLPPNKCLIVSHQSRGSNLYGHSRHDAAYEPFVDWQQTRADAKRLRAKLSGILPILFYPPGNQPDGTSNSTIANQVLQTLGLGFGTAMPSEKFDSEAIARNPKLATTSFWRLEFYDAGTLAPAQAGMLDAERYDDVQMIRAWGLPERSIFEGEHGNKADATKHSDNTVLSKEVVAADIANQLSRGNPVIGVTGWIDDILRYNFGEQAVGKVLLKSPPLADTKLGAKMDFIKSWLACTNPAVAIAVAKSRNMDNIMNDLGLAASDEAFSVTELESALKLQSLTVDATQPTTVGKEAVPPVEIKGTPVAQSATQTTANSNGKPRNGRRMAFVGDQR